MEVKVMQLRILTEGDVRRAVSMAQAIEAMREAFGQLSSGRARVPLRLTMQARKGVEMFMPAYLEDSGSLGAKILSIYHENPQRGLPALIALVLVLDDETGMPLALMGGTYLTALRTGAGSGLATEFLARDDASVVAVFGAGAQARTQLEAVRTVRPIQEVRIVDIVREAAERFANEIEGVDVRVIGDRTTAVQGADVIITATTSRTPVFDGRDIETGTHINGIGSYTPEMQEVDVTALKNVKIVVGSRAAALKEGGDLIIPINQGLITADTIYAELGEIVNGIKPGRTSPDEITFYKTVGNAVQDVATARLVLQAAEEQDLGTVVEI
jgi:alanine dehydrogenase